MRDSLVKGADPTELRKDMQAGFSTVLPNGARCSLDDLRKVTKKNNSSLEQI